jgi:hypothetical protein
VSCGDARAEELDQAALQDGLAAWPFRGRLLLAYGRWVRRRRRAVVADHAPSWATANAMATGQLRGSRGGLAAAGG